MKALTTAALMFGLFWTGCAEFSEPTPISESVATARLEVRFSGLQPGRGPLVAAIYSSREAFESETSPLTTSVLPARDETAIWSLEVPFGTYAVKVYQDLDDNGRLDRGNLGRPTEPYGFSKDARGSFGPPSWEEASLTLDRSSVSIDIQLD